MDSAVSHLIHVLRDRVDAFVAEGNHAEAIHAATAAVEKATQALSSDLDSIDEFASALEIRGELYRQLGRMEEARNDLKDALDQLEDRPDRQALVAKLTASLGAVHDSLGNTERAAELWHQALILCESADPPLLLDAAIIANNLAYVKKADGDFDAAENHLLKALEISHRELGPEHEQTAVVSNNLGALYHRAGHHEQAREMHLMALEARRKALGPEHPDTAQSYNNLALSLIETGDGPKASEHFQTAVDILEPLGAEYRDELEAVIENFCDFLRSQDQEEAALALEKRLQVTSFAS
jgi:tetratricopeptide (TPR) repeat protein